MRYLGIDYGLKKVGLALSDESGRWAFPYEVLENNDRLIDKVVEICKKNEVDKIVLGLSLNFKGDPNPIMEDIEKFKSEIEKEPGLEVFYENETLTTKQAAGFSGKPKTDTGGLRGDKDKLDASAAALILQSYLDKR
jgi:putative Holliday junction resolvase